jgi:prefoldin subunit 5
VRKAGLHRVLGTLQADIGLSAEAKTSIESALAILQRLADAHPAVTEFQNSLASIHMRIAGLQNQTKALESQQRAVVIW